MSEHLNDLTSSTTTTVVTVVTVASTAQRFNHKDTRKARSSLRNFTRINHLLLNPKLSNPKPTTTTVAITATAANPKLTSSL